MCVCVCVCLWQGLYCRLLAEIARNRRGPRLWRRTRAVLQLGAAVVTISAARCQQQPDFLHPHPPLFTPTSQTILAQTLCSPRRENFCWPNKLFLLSSHSLTYFRKDCTLPILTVFTLTQTLVFFTPSLTYFPFVIPWARHSPNSLEYRLKNSPHPVEVINRRRVDARHSETPCRTTIYSFGKFT